MADKAEIIAFFNARDKQNKSTTIKELMKEFNFKQITAETYYARWKKEYMKGGDKVDMAQKISKETFEMVKADGDRKQLLEEIEILKKHKCDLKNSNVSYMADISNMKEANDILREQNESLINENQGLNDVMYESKETIEELKKAKLICEENLGTCLEENGKLFQENLKLTNRSDQLEAKIKCLEGDKEELMALLGKSQLASDKTEISLLAAENEKMQKVICKMTMEKYCNEVR